MAQDFFNGAPYNGNPNNGGVSIQTSSTLLIAANANRQGLTITNAGANPVYLALGSNITANATSGIYLIGPGGALQWDQLMKWQGAVQAIATGGASLVTFSEI